MKPRRDIDDIDTLFDQEETQRRQAERVSMITAGEVRLRQEAERDAAAKKRTVAFMAETNQNMILAQYRAAGVEPPSKTLVSLTMLFSLGWRIEEVDGVKTLVAPPPLQKYVARGECS